MLLRNIEIDFARKRVCGVLIMVFRIMILAYSLSMLIYNFSTNHDIAQSFRLTHWSEALTIISFVISTLITFASNRDVSKGWQKTFYIVQMLSVNVQMVVVLLYWPIIAPGLQNIAYISIHLHGVLFLLNFINVFLDQLPVEILHFLYVSVFLLAYSFFTLILHWTGIESAVYGSISDWRTQVPYKVLAVFLLCFVCPFCTNLFLLILFRLRSCCCRKALDSNGIMA